nr:MAG TPA: protein of unknown function (DUF1882) [Caudoviricetes sp.]
MAMRLCGNNKGYTFWRVSYAGRTFYFALNSHVGMGDKYERRT